MADHSPATRAIICAIRAAIDAEYARSPAPPSTDDFAAAVVRALADHQQAPLALGQPIDHWNPDEHTRQELRNIAAELKGSHA